MTTHINVEYPTMEHKVLRTVAQLRAAGYKADKDQVAHIPVNRPQAVYVKTSLPILSMEEMCLQQTGMTPSAYQARHKRAWNE